MSIFVRPESPPPRQPSPDIAPAPLPYPHHPRRVASQPKIRVCSPSPTPSRPPGLQSPTRTLQSARSYDHMIKAHSDHNNLMIPRKRTFPALRTRRSGPHRLTLTRRSSVRICPVADSPPPAPVPSSSKRILRPQPISFDSLYLPHKDEMGANSLTQPKPSTKPVIPPPLRKHQSLGMACLRFFRCRNSCTSKTT